MAIPDNTELGQGTELTDGGKWKVLKPGDIVTIHQGHDITAKVPKHFMAGGQELDWELESATFKPIGDLSFATGLVIVDKVELIGEGDNFPEYYISAHHLHNGLEVLFLQELHGMMGTNAFLDRSRGKQVWVA